MRAPTTTRNGITTVEGKRGNTYRVNYRYGGRQTGTTFPSYATAVRFRDWQRANPDADPNAFDAPASAVAAPGAGTPTLAAFYAAWSPTRRVSEDRRKADDSLFRVQLAALHSTRLDAFTPMQIETWLNEMAACGKWKTNTIVDAFRCLKKILNAAIRNKVITMADNVTNDVDAPDAELAEVTADDVYSREDLAAVIKAAPDRYRALFATLGYTGARLSEALALTPDLVSLDGHCNYSPKCPKTPHIHLGLFRIKEVRGVGPVRVSGGKTRNARRTVELSAENARLLADHMAEFPPTANTLFPNEVGEIPNRSNLRQRPWKKACDVAGVRYIPMRNLRHTHATHLFAAGYTPVAVAARLGHWSPTITLTIYARFIPGDGVTEMDKLERFLA